MKKITKLIAVFISSLAVTSCFDMTEHPYTLMDASNYFTDETAVKQAIANIYAQEQGDISEFYWYAAELTADQIAWRSWNGGSWGWDSGDKFVLSTHTWTPLSTYVNRIWNSAWTAIGLCNNFIYDLTNIDAASIGITEQRKQDVHHNLEYGSFREKSCRYDGNQQNAFRRDSLFYGIICKDSGEGGEKQSLEQTVYRDNLCCGKGNAAPGSGTSDSQESRQGHERKNQPGIAPYVFFPFIDANPAEKEQRSRRKQRQGAFLGEHKQAEQDAVHGDIAHGFPVRAVFFQQVVQDHRQDGAEQGKAYCLIGCPP